MGALARAGVLVSTALEHERSAARALRAAELHVMEGAHQVVAMPIPSEGDVRWVFPLTEALKRLRQARVDLAEAEQRR